MAVRAPASSHRQLTPLSAKSAQVQATQRWNKVSPHSLSIEHSAFPINNDSYASGIILPLTKNTGSEIHKTFTKKIASENRVWPGFVCFLIIPLFTLC